MCLILELSNDSYKSIILVVKDFDSIDKRKVNKKSQKQNLILVQIFNCIPEINFVLKAPVHIVRIS